VIIDDIDTIFRDRSAASDEQKKLVTALLTFMDGVSSQSINSGVFFIASSSRPQNIDRALRRPGRLDVELELPVPSGRERFEILSIILKNMQVSCISNAGVSEVAEVAHGMVASDLELLVKEAFLIELNNQSDPSTLSPGMNRLSLNDSVSAPMELTGESLRAAVKKVSPSALREISIEVPNVKWTDIGGMNSVKDSLREVVEWPLLHSHLFESMNISPPRGVLLYGPPVCSKTLMAKALATETSMNFLAGLYDGLIFDGV
jgi:AAA family ATPase